ncbi:MAG: hypothetical protein QW728_05995, partial [Thermoplasmata archaeon]
RCRRLAALLHFVEELQNAILKFTKNTKSTESARGMKGIRNRYELISHEFTITRHYQLWNIYPALKSKSYEEFISVIEGYVKKTGKSERKAAFHRGFFVPDIELTAGWDNALQIFPELATSSTPKSLDFFVPEFILRAGWWFNRK